MASGFCPKCGTARTGERFCANCGNDFWRSAQAPQQAEAPQPAQPLQALPQPQQPRQQNNTAVGCGALLAILGVIWIISKVMGGGGSSTSGGGNSTDSTPAPAYTLTVDSAKYTTDTFVGGDITLRVAVSNSGSAKNPSTEFQISDLGDYADVVDCSPDCEAHEGFGGYYATLPGIAPGGSATYTVTFLAKAVGAAKWSICVYDDANSGNQVYCGNATTEIR
jgi:hypothetical protein